MSGPSAEVLRARAYLSRVAEPPSPALSPSSRPWDRSRRPTGCGPRTSRTSSPARPRPAARSTVPRRTWRPRTLRGPGCSVPEDPAWPHGALAACTLSGVAALAPPVALWVRGPRSAHELSDRAVAVVGARAATGYGTHLAGEFGAGLAAAGTTVVSGAAIGIDGAAHRGALAADGATVAVLACGVDRAYPAGHATLLQRIAATGLVVSEYPPGSVPARHRFLVRNRLIAALGGGTVVVEAALRSGAQRTAIDTETLGRLVMAVPGPVTSGPSAGCHQLIRDGALLVTSVGDVLEAVGRLGVDLAPEPETAGPPHGRPGKGCRPRARRTARAGGARHAVAGPRVRGAAGRDPRRTERARAARSRTEPRRAVAAAGRGWGWRG